MLLSIPYHPLMKLAFEFSWRWCKFCEQSKKYSVIPCLRFSPAVLHHLINGANFQQSPVTFTSAQVVGSEMKIDPWASLIVVHIIFRRRKKTKKHWCFTSQGGKWGLFTEYSAFSIHVGRRQRLPCAEQPLPCVENIQTHEMNCCLAAR